MLRHRFHHTSFRNVAVGFRSSHRYCSGCFHFSRATAENTTSQRRSRGKKNEHSWLLGSLFSPLSTFFLRWSSMTRHAGAQQTCMICSRLLVQSFQTCFSAAGFFFFFFSSPHLSFLTQTWIWGQNVKVLRSTRCLFVHLVHFLIFCPCLDLCASSGDFFFLWLMADRNPSVLLLWCFSTR